MPSRIEIELTSRRDEGTWTWRAAGAREPKGTLETAVLPDGADVGDVFRAEADFGIDGITVLSVTSPERPRSDPQTLELIGSAGDDPLVTTTLARQGRDDRGDRGDRKRNKKKGGPRPDGGRGEGGAKRSRTRREQPEVPPPPTRPKPPRLRAGRTHRNAALDALPAEQRPIAEQALKGGIPAVRQAVTKQNATLEADGKPEIKAGPLVAMAESLLPALRAADWRDRAEAALAQLETVDLRDLRSVVTAADGAARDDETRALAADLRAGLGRRLDQEHAAWVGDLTEAIENGRTIRALRLSSRPPKAGTPVPAELAERLVAMTNASLTAEISADRWARILDALSYSPLRRLVVPASLPTKPGKELTETIARLGDRLPELAHIFGIEPETASQRRKRRRGARKRPPKPAAGAPPKPPKSDDDSAEAGADSPEATESPSETETAQ